MRAAVLHEFGKALQFEEVEIGAVARDEVLVRIAASGICHSDRDAQFGHSPRAKLAPIILGHESAGARASRARHSRLFPQDKMTGNTRMDVNHIGITVGDLDAAVKFYTSVLGLTVLVPGQTSSLKTAYAERRRDVFGEQWGEMRLAHLATPSGIGIELFEFVTPATVKPDQEFDYWRIGISHLCLTVDDLDGTIEKLIAAGGRARSEIHTVWHGTRICYCQDPWGVVIELSSQSYHHITGLRQVASV